VTSDQSTMSSHRSGDATATCAADSGLQVEPVSFTSSMTERASRRSNFLWLATESIGKEELPQA
jgi:hypothetical protein